MGFSGAVGLLPQKKEISRHRGNTALTGGEFSAPGWCVQFGGSSGSRADFPRAATVFEIPPVEPQREKSGRYAHLCSTPCPLCRSRKILAPQRIFKFLPRCPPFFSTPHPEFSVPGLFEARSSGERCFPDLTSLCSYSRPEQRILPPQAPWSKPQQR